MIGVGRPAGSREPSRGRATEREAWIALSLAPGIGPVGFWDPLTITVWEQEPDGSARCEVMHTGAVVRGDGEFRVVAEGPASCRFMLWENLEVPGGPFGALLWRVVGRFVNRGAGSVLRRMARRVETDHAGGARA